jgi:hypothetical protein
MSASPVDLGLLPVTARIGADGRLSIGGCDLGELAERFGYYRGGLERMAAEYLKH